VGGGASEEEDAGGEDDRRPAIIAPRSLLCGCGSCSARFSQGGVRPAGSGRRYNDDVLCHRYIAPEEFAWARPQTRTAAFTRRFWPSVLLSARCSELFACPHGRTHGFLSVAFDVEQEACLEHPEIRGLHCDAGGERAVEARAVETGATGCHA